MSTLDSLVVLDAGEAGEELGKDRVSQLPPAESAERGRGETNHRKPARGSHGGRQNQEGARGIAWLACRAG